MPILRMRDIRDMSTTEREKRLSELRADLVRMRTLVNAGGAIENPSRIRDIKRTIARILTVINERPEGEKAR